MANNTTNSPFSSAQFNTAVGFGTSTLLSADKFKMPSEPRPLSSFDSDDESFVVLGNSLIPDDETPSDEIVHPIGTSVVEEAKQLISKELHAMEQMSLKNKTVPKETDDIVVSNEKTASNVFIKSEKLDGSIESAKGPSSDLPEMPHVNRGFDTTNTISIATFSSDLNSVEVQSKISQIIDENIHLKDTILQNNMSMKSQYERIVAWQEDVQKVHQQHKEKILEAKEIIEKLKKEHNNLTQEIDRFKQIIDMQNEELSTLKKELKNNGEHVAETTENRGNLQEIIDKLHDELSFLKIQMENQEKTADLKLKNSKASFEETIANQKQQLEFLKNELQTTEKQVNEKLSESTDNLKKVIEAQKHELSALKIVLKDKEQRIDEKLVQTTDNNLKEFELEVATKKIKELEATLQNLTLENSLLKNEKQQLSEDVGEIKKQEHKLQETLKQLKEAESELETLKTTSAEKEKARTKAMDELRLQIAVLNQHQANMPSPEELFNVKTQLNNTQIILTQVEQSRATAYSQINLLNQEIEGLNKKLQDHQAQESNNLKDELFALQTQLEVYKADFEQERKVKEAIKEEKEKLNEDLQALHRRNMQLQEEIEIIRENRDFHVYPRPNRASSSNTTPSAPSDSPPLSRYACPVCQIRFRSLRLLQEHVDLCIRHRS